MIIMNKSIAPISGLSNEILWILVAQRTTELLEVKVIGQINVNPGLAPRA